MKIKKIRIQNFRSIKDQEIEVDDYTAFVGPNGAGKSTILCALNVFFRQHRDSMTDLSRLSEQDFHHKNTLEPIKITVTFGNITQSAAAHLADYIRHGQLVLSAIAKFDGERADVRQYGSRLVIKDFAVFFEKEKVGDKVADLKACYEEVREKYNDLPAPATKAAMIDSLRAYEADHEEQCELLESEDQFYGASKGTNRLAPYIQWVFVPAVKDASSESEEGSNSALGQLLARSVRSRVNFDEKIQELTSKAKSDYQKILDDQQEALDEISCALNMRLQSWADPSVNARVKWKHDTDRSVRVEKPLAQILLGEKGFQGELPRFGHGLQRSYILALLHELSQLADGSEMPRLVLGIEEPELFQHPPQARHLSEVLQQLSVGENQVLLCTHSPQFVNGTNFEQVRMVRGEGDPIHSVIKQATYQEIATSTAIEGKQPLRELGAMTKIHQALTPMINELFFTEKLILVEGLEDIAYLQTYITLLDMGNLFRQNGCHIVPTNGKSEMPRALAIAMKLGIPCFVLFDADSDASEEKGDKEKHRKDNNLIMGLAGHQGRPAFPDEDTYLENVVYWKTQIYDVVASEINDYKSYEDKAASYFGNPGGLNKNTLAIGYALELAWQDGKKSTSLERLVNAVISFS